GPHIGNAQCLRSRREPADTIDDMSLTGPDFWSPDQGNIMPVGTGRTCFLCGVRIKSEPAWTWAGETGQIWLHPGCANDLMLRLGSDLLRLQKATGRRFGEAST